MRSVAITAGRILLAIILFPVALVAAVFAGGEERTAAEVAGYIRNFLEGECGEWDWDDFISIPIADPALETVRKRALIVDLSLTAEGRLTLSELLAEVEQMASN
jgi:hypothetical protein